MPNSPLYACRYPTCSNRVKRSGYCAKHGGSKRAHPMNYAGAWSGIRAAQLEAEPRCRACGAPATEVDHIVPLTPVPGSGQQAGTHDRANLQSLCHQHAREKTGIENRQRFGSRRASA